MNGSAKIQAHHRERQAVVYLRQSSPKQVLHHRESAVNQRALRERLLELGWDKSRIVVIDDDQGRSAKQAHDREGFQRLVADVSLRRIGIIMGYEVSRLSRNCADWHRLLELCALFDTLIADADGIYHPHDFNDRLLLGLKGTLSEAELHSLRLRLDAGRLSKARRGELRQKLPTGYVYVDGSGVCLDPDQAVQDRIRLVFAKFLELGSCPKVLRFLAKHRLKLPRRQVAGPYAGGGVLWRQPSASMLLVVLKNPAYAGAFVYGRRQADPQRCTPDRPGVRRCRQPQEKWLALVKGVYPTYISWEQYELIQTRLAENAQKMADNIARRQVLRGGAAILTGLARCGFCGASLEVIYKGGRADRFVYRCGQQPRRFARPACQSFVGARVDAAVVQEFFAVLQPAQIDAWEQVQAQEARQEKELRRHREQEVERLRYAAARAERQYDCVDPDNRLIAATLEKKWESALAELEQARAQLDEHRRPSLSVSAQDRAAFADVGRRLPELWPQLSAEARKQLLRTLVSAVNLKRDGDSLVHIRIVWQGGLVTQTNARVPLSTRRRSSIEQTEVARIRALAEQGLRDEAIAARLNEEGLIPCRRAAYTVSVVANLRARYGIYHGFARRSRSASPQGYTIRELAGILGVKSSWIYHGIHRARIRVHRHAYFGCYLFPRTKETIRRLRRLHAGKIAEVSFLEEHCSG
jgi:DNA invertase Pin-like site-specific DNA recombinase